MDGISRIGAEGIFVEPVKYEGFKYTLYDSTKAHRLGPLSDKSVQVYRCHSTIYINADDSLLFNWCFYFILWTEPFPQQPDVLSGVLVNYANEIYCY